MKTNPEPSRAMTLILMVLTKGTKHGYAIMAEIARMTNGEYEVSAGTLYRSLDQMVFQKLVEEVKEMRHPDDDERRRYYRITERGRQAVCTEFIRLKNLVAIGEQLRLNQLSEWDKSIKNVAKPTWGMSEKTIAALDYLGTRLHTGAFLNRKSCPISVRAANRLVRIGLALYSDSAEVNVKLTPEGYERWKQRHP